MELETLDARVRAGTTSELRIARHATTNLWRPSGGEDERVISGDATPTVAALP